MLLFARNYLRFWIFENEHIDMHMHIHRCFCGVGEWQVELCTKKVKDCCVESIFVHIGMRIGKKKMFWSHWCSNFRQMFVAVTCLDMD